MKNIAALFLISAIAVASSESSACSPLFHDPRSDFTDAQSIVIGYVTGNKHVYYEAHLLAGGNPDTGQVGDVLVRVAPTEAPKGIKPTHIIEVVADCMGASPKIGARVVVVQIGARNYLIEYSGYEDELRQIMSPGR